MKILQVGGRWGDDGKTSGYATKLFNALIPLWNKIGATPITCNGGSWDDLLAISRLADSQDVALWFPDCPNDKPKLVEEIKQRNPKCLLVTSKYNGDNKYSVLHLAARMLKVKSNLLLEFRTVDGKHQARLLDPLGNQFNLYPGAQSDFYTEIDEVAIILFARVQRLTRMRRVGSRVIGPYLPVPTRNDFFELAREQAQTFHDLIHVDTTRFLGNLSFRCENGFPSFRNGGIINVSKRNIDKREITAEGFIPVEFQDYNPEEVGYYSDIGDKPSVDTPVQIALYKHFVNINYMIHSHVYIEGAPKTERVLPCGVLEEVDNIRMVIPHDVTKFAINLRGHGSLVAGQTVADLRGVKYIPRPIPEKQFV